LREANALSTPINNALLTGSAAVTGTLQASGSGQILATGGTSSYAAAAGVSGTQNGIVNSGSNAGLDPAWVTVTGSNAQVSGSLSLSTGLFSNGATVIDAQGEFCSGGAILIASGDIFYPNGNTLSGANKLYYSNGNAMTSGSSATTQQLNYAYPANMVLAKSGTLYGDISQTTGGLTSVSGANGITVVGGTSVRLNPATTGTIGGLVTGTMSGTTLMGTYSGATFNINSSGNITWAPAPGQFFDTSAGAGNYISSISSPATLTLKAPTTILNNNFQFTTSGGYGIPGATGTNNALSGNIGELYFSTVAPAGAVSLATGTSSNITSISLSPGHWWISGGVNVIYGAASTVTELAAAMSITSGSIPADGHERYSLNQIALASGTDSITLEGRRLVVSSTTTLYLEAAPSFSAGSATGYGSIQATRLLY
jgi:hypothetical protein